MLYVVIGLSVLLGVAVVIMIGARLTQVDLENIVDENRRHIESLGKKLSEAKSRERILEGSVQEKRQKIQSLRWIVAFAEKRIRLAQTAILDDMTLTTDEQREAEKL